MTHPTKPSLIRLGHIAAAHGIKGEVKIHSETHIAQDITAYGPLLDNNGIPLPTVTVTGAAGGRLIARIAGVTDRTAAERLTGTELFIERSQLPPAGKGEYYHHDLIGLEVRLEDGSLYGTVAHISNYGAGDIVEISPANGGPSELLPFTQVTFPEVDVESGTIVLHPPEEVEAKE